MSRVYVGASAATAMHLGATRPSSVLLDGSEVAETEPFRVVVLGQSEHQQFATRDFADPTEVPAVIDPGALRVAYSTNNRAQGYALPASVEVHDVTDETPGSGTLVTLSNWLATHLPGRRFEVAIQACEGTGMVDMVDDAETERLWANEWNIYDALWGPGVEPDLAVASWYAAQSGGGYVDLLQEWYFGDSGTYDHAVVDKLGSTPLMVCGPHRFEDPARTAINAAKVAVDAYFSGTPRAGLLRGPESLSYLNGTDTFSPGTWGDLTHPSDRPEGGARHAVQFVGMAIAQRLLGGDLRPGFTAAALDAGGAFVRVTAATDVYTQASLDGDAAPRVAGFYWGSTPATRAELVQGGVNVYWNEAGDAIPAGSALRLGDVHATAPGGVTDVFPGEVWRDWPLTTVSGVPEVPLVNSVPAGLLDVVPATSIPADTNPNPNLVAELAAMDAADGWTFENGATSAEITFDGAGVMTLDNLNNGYAQVQLPFTGSDYEGRRMQLNFTPTGDGTGNLRLRVLFQSGTFVDALRDDDYAPTVGAVNTFEFDLPATVTSTVIVFQFGRRSFEASGSYQLNNVTFKEVTV